VVAVEVIEVGVLFFDSNNNNNNQEVSLPLLCCIRT
jgi:hypothetical protein